MNLTSILQGNHFPRPSETFGRIGRRHVPAALARSIRAARAIPDEAMPPRAELDACALRALAANGLGAAALVHNSSAERLSAVELQRLARTQRSNGLGRSLAAAWQIAKRRARLTIAALERRRAARATYLALSELDPRTLRDLGFDRSELRSVAAEAASVTPVTRLRLDRALRGLY